jgi:transcriptional regulator with XRE-family HTH domain
MKNENRVRRNSNAAAPSSQQQTSLAARLRELRYKHSLTLQQVAERIGYDKSYLSRLERGESCNPSWGFVEKLCQQFGVNRDWLTGDKSKTEVAATIQKNFSGAAHLELHTAVCEAAALLEMFKELFATQREMQGDTHAGCYASGIIGLSINAEENLLVAYENAQAEFEAVKGGN